VRQEIQIVLHPGSTRSMRIPMGMNLLAITPNAFFKTYLMCNSAAPPLQHLRKHDLYIPKDDLKDSRNYFALLLIASATAEIQ
jgi:hypothetical protein